MLLSAQNVTSGKTVSYRIEDLNGNILQAFTSTNVKERHENPLVSGSATSALANKLIDTGVDFVGGGIGIGDFVYNKTANTKTTVSAVDSATQLSLVADIFTAGQSYSIGDSLGRSIYQVEVADTLLINSDGTEFEGHILWRTNDVPPLSTSETINKLTNQLFPSGSVVTDAGNTSSTFKTNLTQTTTDYWKNTWLRFTTGTLVNQLQKVSAYDGSTKFITVSSTFTATPTGSDAFVLINK